MTVSYLRGQRLLTSKLQPAMSHSKKLMLFANAAILASLVLVWTFDLANSSCSFTQTESTIPHLAHFEPSPVRSRARVVLRGGEA